MDWWRLGGLMLAGASSLAASDSPVIVAEGSLSLPAGQIAQELRALGETARVLHIAAHPDDENTRLLTQLANAEGIEVAYLSLTRGDGGQNLIGPELREKLGLIRTQELLAARRLDGARQFFTRAVDFGYSKTEAETLAIWDHEAVLGDVVRIVRRFQPDVIITRFEPEVDYTHGHHTASAWLAIEAFEAAGDPERFPEQLETLAPWRPKRVVWNTFRWFYERSGREFDPAAFASLETGSYLPARGESVGAIAAQSRSMHKSQGFGAGGSRGRATEYFDLLVGEPMGEDPLEGVGRDWTSRVPQGEPLDALAEELARAFDPMQPGNSVPGLLEFRRALEGLPDSALVRDKRRAVDRLLLAALGMHAEFLVPEPRLIPGDSVTGEIQLIQRQPGAAVEVVEMRPPFAGSESLEVPAGPLPINEPVVTEATFTIPPETAYDQPYWLKEEGTLGLFAVDDPALIGDPENPPSVFAALTLAVGGARLAVQVPAVWRTVDRVDGETREPARLVPPVYANFDNAVELFPQGKSRAVALTIGSNRGAFAGRVRLEAPAGWQVRPESIPVSLTGAEKSVEVVFTVTPPATAAEASESILRAIVEGPDESYDRGFVTIDYPHIPPQTLVPPSTVRAVPIDLAPFSGRVGYLEGAGDAVAASLRAIGVEVLPLEPSEVSAESLAAGGFNAVVLGIRALNVVENIDALMPEFFAFAEAGGTVVVQYNTTRGLLTERLAPFPLGLSRDRVTDEHAEATLLVSDHPAFTTPHRLGESDFAGWVQERGLYFPSSWDPAFVPLLSWHDPGEAPLSGGLLVAETGEGHFVYTGISFFRQLPAGVPGAYRLFLNLLSLDQND